MSELSPVVKARDMKFAPTLPRSLWARLSPRLPSDSGKTRLRFTAAGLLPSLQSIRGGAPKLTLPPA